MNNTTTTTEKTVLSLTKEAKGICLSYYLTEETVQTKDRSAFSVTVTSVSESGKDSVTAHDISSVKERAVEIVALLADNLVTPPTLYDVLEEIL